MNLKNMRRLRAHLRSRKNPVGFNMAKFFWHNGHDLVTPAAVCRAVEKHSCGTVACISGHAAILAWQSGDMPKSRKSIPEVAAKWLGLDEWEANSLFYGHWPGRPRGLLMSEITKSQAITELTRLIDAA